jgi:hypothetical protein
LTRKLNIILLALLILIGAPFYWLVLNTSSDGETRHALTITQLRDLAGALPGDVPIDVRYETLGQRRVVSDLLAAGSGLRPVPYVIRAFQLILRGGDIITIDRGLNREYAQAERLANYDPRAQATVDSAVKAALTSLTLAPRVPHTGLKAAPTRFGSGLTHSEPDPRTLPYPVAPGVVVIPVSDVGPDERMVFVLLADGTELLFAGDVAPTREAWLQQRPPARLATSYGRTRNREALARWLRTIFALKTAAPDLLIVAGHDAGVPRGITQGFIASDDQSLRSVR